MPFHILVLHLSWVFNLDHVTNDDFEKEEEDESEPFAFTGVNEEMGMQLNDLFEEQKARTVELDAKKSEQEADSGEKGEGRTTTVRPLTHF